MTKTGRITIELKVEESMLYSMIKDFQWMTIADFVENYEKFFGDSRIFQTYIGGIPDMEE